MNFKKLFLLFLAVLPVCLQADIIDASVWERQSVSGKKQHLFICGDQHDLLEDGYNQALELSRICKESGASHMVFEDINDLDLLADDLAEFEKEHDDVGQVVDRFQNMHDAYAKHKLFVKDRRSNDLLNVLKSISQEDQIPFTNVDFRFGLTPDAPAFPFDDALTSQILSHRMVHRLDMLREKTDDIVVQRFFDKRIAQFEPFMQEICEVMRQHSLQYKDLPDYYLNLFKSNPKAYKADVFLPAMKEDNVSVYEGLNEIISLLAAGESSDDLCNVLREELEFAFYVAMTDIIDLFLLQKIYTKQLDKQESDLLVVCAGQEHTRAIESVLSDLGYKKVAKWQDGYQSDFGTFCRQQSEYINNESKMAYISAFVGFVKNMFSYVSNLFA